MAMISWPFDSTVTYDGQGNPIYTKTYSSDVLANILRKYFRNGVFTDSEDCFQVLENSGMELSVSPGHCLIQGRHGYNEAYTTLTVSNADPALPRIDLVVLRLNLGVSALSIELFMVDGTAAVSPVAPALTRNSTIYELALAEIYVAAGVTAITQAVITDTRLDSDRCGVVASILGDTDTSTYYAQIAADLAEFKAGREADFDAWFSGIVDILDENTAGNLLNLINKYKAKTTTVVLDADDWTGEGPYTQTKSVSLVPADCVLHAGPVESSRDAYAASDVHVSAASEGSVTFAAVVEPEEDLTVQIAVSGVDA